MAGDIVRRDCWGRYERCAARSTATSRSAFQAIKIGGLVAVVDNQQCTLSQGPTRSLDPAPSIEIDLPLGAIRHSSSNRVKILG